MRDHHEFESPVDLAHGGAGRGALRWTTITISVASYFLLATNAFSLRGWIDEQPPGPWQAQLARLAEQWEVMTGSLGLGAPRATIHKEWKAAEAARFEAEPPAQR